MYFKLTCLFNTLLSVPIVVNLKAFDISICVTPKSPCFSIHLSICRSNVLSSLNSRPVRRELKNKNQ